MTLGQRAAEPHQQTARESRFLRHPKKSVRLSVSFPSGTMVKIFNPDNLIKEKERRE
jgi:hypothetical protein